MGAAESSLLAGDRRFVKNRGISENASSVWRGIHWYMLSSELGLEISFPGNRNEVPEITKFHSALIVCLVLLT
jgi:hypothetical protein